MTLNTYYIDYQKDEERFLLAKWLYDKMNILLPELDLPGVNFMHSYVKTLDNFAAAHLHLGDHNQSVKYFELALEFYYNFQLQDQFPEAARTLYQDLGTTYGLLEKWEKSNQCFQQAFKIAQQHKDKEGIAGINFNIAKNFLEQENYEQATKHLKTAAKIYEALQVSYWIALTYKYQGMVLSRQKQYSFCLSYFDKARLIFYQLQNYHRLAELHDEYCICYLGMGRFKKALEHAKQATNYYIYESQHDKEAVAYLNLCNVSIGLQTFDECEDYLKKAVTIMIRLNNKELLKTAMYLASLIEQLIESGLVDRLMDILLQSYSIEEIHEFLDL